MEWEGCKDRYIKVVEAVSKRVLFYAHFDKKGRLSSDDLKSLSVLERSFDRIIFLTSNSIDIKNNKYCVISGIPNVGLDFGKYLYYFKNRYSYHKNFDSFYFINNSVIVCRDVRPSLEVMNYSDLWGYTSSKQIRLHLQSYFYGMNNEKTLSIFSKYLSRKEDVIRSNKYSDIVREVECQFLEHARSKGIRCASFIDTSKITSGNPTLLFPDLLLKYNNKFPIIKKKAFDGNNKNYKRHNIRDLVKLSKNTSNEEKHAYTNKGTFI